MRSPLEFRGALSALGVVALLVACLTLGKSFIGQAEADPAIGLPKLAGFDEPINQRPKLAVRYANYQEEEEEEEEDIEEEFDHFEMERLMLETFYGGLEIVEKVGQLAADDDGIVALAITSAEDMMERDDRVEFLKRVAAEAPRKSARRLARLQLAEVYGEDDNPAAARKQLEALIFEAD